MKLGNFMAICIFIVQTYQLQANTFGMVSSNTLKLGNRFRHTRYGGIENCGKRKRNLDSRKCFRQCASDSDCRGSKRRCLCDGECGLSCVRTTQSCSKVGVFENGRTIYNPNNYFGGYLIYECNAGYTLVGENHRICEGDGWWSGQTPICTKEIYCDQPPKISNGMANIQLTNTSKYKPGTEIEYHCDVGYKSNDDPNKSVCENGQWTDIKYECLKIDCGQPGFIDNGELIAYDFTYSSVIEYRCNLGYRINSGHYLRECLITGQWSGDEPTCKPVVCGEPPEVLNTRVKFDSMTYGSKAFYTCAGNGFIFENEITYVECLNSGQWSENLPKCIERNCTINPSDMVPNGFLKTTSESALGDGIFAVGTQIEFECDEKYELVGSRLSSCLKTGQWDNFFPVCVLNVYCSTPEIPDHALVTTTQIKTEKGYPYETIMEFTCLDGYFMQGSNKQTCSMSGQWTISNTTCTKVVTTTSTTTTTTNFVIQLKNINTEFTALENQNSTNDVANCFVVDFFENKNVLLDNSSLSKHLAILKNNESVYYACKTATANGFPFKAICLNGSLSFDERCEEANIESILPVPMCSSPDKISNGYLKVGSYANGSKAIYQCFNGFELRHGDRELYCSNGDWVGKVPVCAKTNCGFPGLLENGQVYYIGTMGEYAYQPYMSSIGQNKQIRYTCEKGYKLIGSTGSTCINGQWKPNLNTTKCIDEAILNSMKRMNNGAVLSNPDSVGLFESTASDSVAMKRINLKERKKLRNNKKLRSHRKHNSMTTIDTATGRQQKMRMSINDLRSIETF